MLEVPGYKIERLIGRGGMASVYLATQESLERLVAIKIMSNPESSEFSERFLNEGRAIASLNHSNIITIYDLGIFSGCHYISMEYLDNGDLGNRIAQGVDLGSALNIVEQIAACLYFVHQHDIIHRDVKPANILFRNDGAPVLTDFGIAKQLQLDSDLTVTGTVLGSPHYLSPEQALAKQVDGRADIYSLGIVLYEMLIGSKPFVGDTDLDTIIKHTQEPVPTLPSHLEYLQTLLERMLAKDPNDRFQDANELVHYIQTIRKKDIPVTTDSSVGKVSLPEKTVLLHKGSHDERVSYQNLTKKLKWPIVGTVLILFLTIAFYFGQNQFSNYTNRKISPSEKDITIEESAGGMASAIESPHQKVESLLPQKQVELNEAPSGSHLASSSDQGTESEEPDTRPFQVIQSVNYRAGPSDTYRKLGMVRKGQILDITGMKNDWYIVLLEGGIHGYIYKTFITPVSHRASARQEREAPHKKSGGFWEDENNAYYDPPRSFQVRRNVNYRAGPSDTHRRLGVVKKGQTLDVTGMKNGWYIVLLEGGIHGYIYKTFLTPVSD